jgi:hypothetical protein
MVALEETSHETAAEVTAQRDNVQDWSIVACVFNDVTDSRFVCSNDYIGRKGYRLMATCSLLRGFIIKRRRLEFSRSLPTV